MSEGEQNALVMQRQILRRRLQAQRSVIAHQLVAGVAVDNSYPRSMTMRFLTQRPALAGRLLTGAATLLVGRRLLRTLTVALAVAGIARAASAITTVAAAPTTHLTR